MNKWPWIGFLVALFLGVAGVAAGLGFLAGERAAQQELQINQVREDLGQINNGLKLLAQLREGNTQRAQRAVNGALENALNQIMDLDFASNGTLTLRPQEYALLLRLKAEWSTYPRDAYFASEALTVNPGVARFERSLDDYLNAVAAKAAHAAP